MIRGGAHVGAVVVASGSELLREVLVPVYEALDLEWEPATAGSVADEVGREVDTEEVAGAVVAELDSRFELRDADVDPDTLALAEQLLIEQRP